VSDWIRRTVTIRNRLGLHARAASLLVRLTGQFTADVYLEKDGIRANAKSIMGILMMAAPKDTVIQVQARGADAEKAMAEVVKLIEVDKFNEL
jgi:phosphocarrier protein